MRLSFRRLLAIAALFATAVPAQAHEVDCKGSTGIELARCERHAKVAGQCGKITGDAHFVCDRDYLIANPLDCKTLAGDEVQQCKAEIVAIENCKGKQAGREFMQCVRAEAKANPMGGNKPAAAKN